MADLKSFASLSSGLLARKGGARPAMRGSIHAMAFPVDLETEFDDDLGWNDMGEEIDDLDDFIAPVIPIGGSKRDAMNQLPTRQHRPEVIAQRDSIASRVSGKSARSARDRRSAFSDGRRAAFTLRVDEERHLRLRLACTVKGVSAQQIVTEALDRLLDELPEVKTLAKKIKSKR